MALEITAADVARITELTLLHKEPTRANLERLCAAARERKSFGVCAHSGQVAFARQLLEDTELKVIAVIGFPFGATHPDAKRYETEIAVDEGAHEIDVLLDLARFKDGAGDSVLRELRDVVEAADERPVKVVIESQFLDREQRAAACRLFLQSNARFISTSAARIPASVETIRELKEAIGKHYGLKTPAGETFEKSVALIQAGATRLSQSFED